MNRNFPAVLASLALLLFSTVVPAQEEARAAWQVTRFDITANIQHSDRTLNAVAVLSTINVGRGAGSSFTFRIHPKASVKAVTVGGATATFRTVQETSGNLQRVTASLPSAVSSGSSTNVSITYSVPVESNTGLEAVSPVGSQFLPLSFWYPAPNSPFSARGADTAPFRLVVNSGNVISSGLEKTGSAGSVAYEQSLSAQPFFLQGDWDRVEGAGEARNISAFVPLGVSPEDKKLVEALISFAGAARTYYASLLGPAPEVPIRLVSVRRGAGFSDGGTILLDSGAFRRTKLDSSTALTISEAIVRLWLGGQTAVRGEGGGVLREGLTRFLATLFLEKQFGRDAASEQFLRERLAYSSVVRRDAPLSLVTLLDATYFSSVANKGAMVWRLMDHSLGRDVFIATVRGLLESGKGSEGITLSAFRNALVERGGARTKLLLDYQLDQVTDLDLMVGMPQQRGAEWVAALRNLGSADVTTNVKAVTSAGEQPPIEVTIPARNFSEAVLRTPAKPASVEIDPAKLFPQVDYTNDSFPRSRDPQEALGEATRLLGAQEFTKAESLARGILAGTPYFQEAALVLARALLGQNKVDEAERVFRKTLESALPTPATLAWANLGLGEILLRKGQAAEAARRFNDAVRADAEYASTLAARAGRIKAETAANTLPVDGAIRAVVAQLDQVITSGKKATLESHIVSGELSRFISGIIGTQPEIWQTRVLRTENLSANLVAVDVSLDTKQLGRQQSGTAVLLFARESGGWKLVSIDLFEVR